MQRLPTPLPPYHLFRNKWNARVLYRVSWSRLLRSGCGEQIGPGPKLWNSMKQQGLIARNDKSAPLSKQPAFHGGIRIHNGSQGLLAALSRTLAASSIGSMKPNPFFSLNLMQWNTMGHHGDFFTTFFYLLDQILSPSFCVKIHKFHALSPLKNASHVQSPFGLPCHLTRPRKRGPSSSTWLKTTSTSASSGSVFSAFSVPFDDASFTASWESELLALFTRPSSQNRHTQVTQPVALQIHPRRLESVRSALAVNGAVGAFSLRPHFWM